MLAARIAGDVDDGKNQEVVGVRQHQTDRGASLHSAEVPRQRLEWCSVLAKTVAIKLIHVEPRDSTTRKRLKAEIQAMERLDGKCAVRIFAANSAANPPYYVMEFVRWGDFRSVLERRVPVSRLLSMFQSICECVAECHALDITHRDIKPENILFRRPNNPILADFGICKLGAAALGTTRMEMERRGTPLYMAPEQLRDHLPQSKPADVYALGTMLHFDLGPTLRHPSLKDRAEKLAERCRAATPQRRPSIQEIIGEIGAMVGLVASLDGQESQVDRLITIINAFLLRVPIEPVTLARTEGLYLRDRMLEFNKLAERTGAIYRTSDHWDLEEVPPYYAPQYISEKQDVPPERRKRNVLREARRFVTHLKRYRRALKR
jgi:serine/threonine protein kinase